MQCTVFRNERDDMEKYIRRDSYLEQLKNRKENGLIKVITGIRRCGKSFCFLNCFISICLVRVFLRIIS